MINSVYIDGVFFVAHVFNQLLYNVSFLNKFLKYFYINDLIRCMCKKKLFIYYPIVN